MAYEHDHTQRNEEAATEAAEQNWPALTGSPRQAAWATTIRSDVLSLLHQKIGPYQAAHYPNRRNVAEMLTSILLTQTRAGWWIDGREAKAVALAASVDLPGVLRALDATPNLDTGRPHTSVHVDVPVAYSDGAPWAPTDRARGALCSCGWTSGDLYHRQSFPELQTHIESIPPQELVDVAHAHPTEPHGCPDTVDSSGQKVWNIGCQTQMTIHSYIQRVRRQRERSTRQD